MRICLIYKKTPKNGKPSTTKYKFNLYSESLSSFCGGCWLHEPELYVEGGEWGSERVLSDESDIHPRLEEQFFDWAIRKSMEDNGNRVISFFSDSDGEGGENALSFWNMADRFDWVETEAMHNPNSNNKVHGWMYTRDHEDVIEECKFTHETSTHIYELYEG